MATKGLGRGLASLFSDTEESYEKAKGVKEGEVIVELSLDAIYPNPDQPRRVFDEGALRDLASSIREHGIIVPIIVNKDEEGKYMIIAGERRFRAARMAGLTTVPTVVKEYTPAQVEEIALIENLQREDLNPIEAAFAMKRLMEEYHLTQEELAVKIGKSRPAITNTLRLLSLPPTILQYVSDGTLTSGHARALLPLPEDAQNEIAKQIIKEGYSVRKTERVVKDYLNPPENARKKKEEQDDKPSIELKNLISRMRLGFKTKVSFIGSDNKGRIYIDYYSRDDLERISEILDILEKYQ
jgi:ParB family chromosome partitioning protein